METFYINKNILYCLPVEQDPASRIQDNTTVIPIKHIKTISRIDEVPKNPTDLLTTDRTPLYMFRIFVTDNLWIPVVHENTDILIEQHAEIKRAIERYHNQSITIPKPKKFKNGNKS